MPYITSEKVKEIRNELKATFPEIKFSVTKEHHSSVTAAIMKSPYEWDPPYQQLNPFYPENSQHPELVKKIVDIMKRDVRTIVVDGDYGPVPNFYVNIHVGKWDRPHEVTK